MTGSTPARWCVADVSVRVVFLTRMIHDGA
jgi:hypothetical protein